MDYTNPNAKHSHRKRTKNDSPLEFETKGEYCTIRLSMGRLSSLLDRHPAARPLCATYPAHGDPPPQGISKKLQERSCGSKVSVAKRYHRDAVGNYDCTNTSRSQHVRWNQQSIRFWRHYLTVQRQSAVDPIVYVGLASKKEALEMQSRRRRMPKLKNLFSLYQQAMFGTSR